MKTKPINKRNKQALSFPETSCQDKSYQGGGKGNESNPTNASADTSPTVGRIEFITLPQGVERAGS